jgi:cytidine deaminase
VKTPQELINKALEAREFAYAPYSGFLVGAALEGKSGQVYTGANVENASYGLTVCAERIAVFKAVSSGEKEFSQIAIAGSGEGPTYPCGACLQVLAEFAPGLTIYTGSDPGQYQVFNLSEMLPQAFSLNTRR